jgi:VanZ family protein
MCVLLLAILSLAPLTADHRTNMGSHVEHVLAYAITTFLFGASRRYRFATVVVGLAMLGAVLEAMQLLTSFRQASPYDYIWSALGVATGAVIWRLAQHIADRVKASLLLPGSSGSP